MSFTNDDVLAMVREYKALCGVTPNGLYIPREIWGEATAGLDLAALEKHGIIVTDKPPIEEHYSLRELFGCGGGLIWPST